MLMNILIPVGVVGAMALIFGGILGLASVIFKVEVDERVPRITEALPGANCGGCGYPGCGAFALAVSQGKAKPNGCPVSTDESHGVIASIMGVKAEKADRMVSKIHCVGTCEKAPFKYDYLGSNDCNEAHRLSGGAKGCAYGCLGLGNCKNVCKFDAITIVDGIAVIDPDKCSACGACVKSCPKKIIKLTPYKSEYWVLCSSQDKGPLVNKVCKVGCISCKLCEKACAYDAIHVENNIAHIDYTKCVHCGKCMEKCPRKIIRQNEGIIEI